MAGTTVGGPGGRVVGKTPIPFEDIGTSLVKPPTFVKMKPPSEMGYDVASGGKGEIKGIGVEKEGKIFLHSVAKSGDLLLFFAARDEGSDGTSLKELTNLLTTKDEEGRTPLHYMAHEASLPTLLIYLYRHVGLAQDVLERMMLEKDNRGHSPLELSFAGYYFPQVALLFYNIDRKGRMVEEAIPKAFLRALRERKVPKTIYDVNPKGFELFIATFPPSQVWKHIVKEELEEWKDYLEKLDRFVKDQMELLKKYREPHLQEAVVKAIFAAYSTY